MGFSRNAVTRPLSLVSRIPNALMESAGTSVTATVTVKRGESLSSVAERAGTTVEDLKRLNRLTSNKVRAGTRLKVRTGEAMARAAEQAGSDSVMVAELKPPKSRSARARGAARTVRVRAGDTLSEIAARHGTTVSRLKALNGLRTSNVRAGQRLRLPA